MDKSFVLHGSVVYSKSPAEMVQLPEAYLVCVDGVSQGVFEELPEAYKGLPVEECGERLIIPGLVDLHVHAPQYNFRGLGMDMELLEWLGEMAFPEESKFARAAEYAEKSSAIFADDMLRGATTRASVFSSADVPSTIRLMEMMEERGLVSYIGKVNMDRNVPDYYCETTEESAARTEAWLQAVEGRFERTMPILTPRFTPSCTGELMKALKVLQVRYHVPVQSHLSENLSEIEWVKELEPESKYYGDAYDMYDMFGGPGCPTIMAHCVWSSDEEIALMKERGVFIAHCPQSNMNVASGIAPVRRYLDEGLHIGLGSDVAGGSETSILTAMKDAIQCSKLRWRLVDTSLKPLGLAEALYMATLGGGAFFGKVGSFEPGYEFDAVVLDDRNLLTMLELTPVQRLERIVYFGDDRNVERKFVRGRKVLDQRA